MDLPAPETAMGAGMPAAQGSEMAGHQNLERGGRPHINLDARQTLFIEIEHVRRPRLETIHHPVAWYGPADDADDQRFAIAS